jgi:predicted GTPase
VDSRHGARAPGSPAARPAAIVLIDGEHYPPVVVDTLRGLSESYDLVAALFVGGGEKLRDRQAV